VPAGRGSGIDRVVNPIHTRIHFYRQTALRRYVELAVESKALIKIRRARDDLLRAQWLLTAICMNAVTNASETLPLEGLQHFRIPGSDLLCDTRKTEMDFAKS
jgi:hypothetical protein